MEKYRLKNELIVEILQFFYDFIVQNREFSLWLAADCRIKDLNIKETE